MHIGTRTKYLEHTVVRVCYVSWNVLLDVLIIITWENKLHCSALDCENGHLRVVHPVFLASCVYVGHGFSMPGFGSSVRVKKRAIMVTCY
jgi:hypothetical protein